jgi:hypothetical protein
MLRTTVQGAISHDYIEGIAEIPFLMISRSLFNSGLFLTVIVIRLTPLSQAQTGSPAESKSPRPSYSLAPYEDRLAAAQSVEVTISILGLELGSTLEQAHAKLDKLSDRAHPPKEEEEGPERKILWQLARTDYSAVFVKSDEKKRITYINGFLRPGKEIPFEKIGDTKKAPLQDVNTIVWDVLRPNRPLFRLVAKGADRKASNITIFVVKRPGLEQAED